MRTDAGRVVTVHGGAMGGAVWTSADRTYTVGTHYEFHPRNDTDPYRDDICTATHPVAAPAPSSTGWLISGVVTGVTAGVVVVGVALGAGLVVIRRRRANPHR
ncbi:hypothetical protein UG55_1022144 [Frankia sp. EI5c]|uniref:hypothetical protein n=1 Tax=Frankia sp. EI5c TaxID=683316 RepID=UPI0007C375FB|nr:hypothetical protein [Frankia sp. EI5c]OAA25484.1 hypothetical protein UG55_1022144 [Frankia sp. EI5c]